jgi:hypothetical protein
MRGMLSTERRGDGLSVRVGSPRESVLKAKVREERFMYRPEKASNRTTMMTTSFGSLRTRSRLTQREGPP